MKNRVKIWKPTACKSVSGGSGSVAGNVSGQGRLAIVAAGFDFGGGAEWNSTKLSVWHRLRGLKYCARSEKFQVQRGLASIAPKILIGQEDTDPLRCEALLGLLRCMRSSRRRRRSHVQFRSPSTVEPFISMGTQQLWSFQEQRLLMLGVGFRKEHIFVPV